MERQWESAPQEQIWENAPEVAQQRDTSLGGQAKKTLEDFGGAGMAAIDMAASMPGFVAAAGAAGMAARPKKLGGIDTGRGPTDTVGEVIQSAQEGNPLNMLPDNYLGLRKSEGYDVANKYMGAAFSGIGQGAGNIAALTADQFNLSDETKAKIGDWTDALVQGGMLAGGMKQGAGIRPGSLEFNKATSPVRPREAAPADSGRDLNYCPGLKRPVFNTVSVA